MRETPKFDRELLKRDMLKVLRRAFKDDTPQLAEFAELIIPEPDLMSKGPDFVMPAGKNVYSIRYTVRMTLEGEQRVRGETVREAKQNLLQELTQELSIRELVAQSTVMSLCPVEDIDIKDSELLHGVEPYTYYVPYAYLPRETAVRVGMDGLLDKLSELIDSPRPLTEPQKEALFSSIEQLKAQSSTLNTGELDLDEDTQDYLREVIRKNPEAVSQLLKEWDPEFGSPDTPGFIKDVLGLD